MTETEESLSLLRLIDIVSKLVQGGNTGASTRRNGNKEIKNKLII